MRVVKKKQAEQYWDIAMAIAFTCGPFGFGVPIKYACISWVAAWLAITHLLWNLEALSHVDRGIKVTFIVLLTVLLVWVSYPPIHAAYYREKSGAMSGDLETVVNDGKDHTSDPPRLQIGTSGVIFRWDKDPPVEYANYSDPIKVERVNGQVLLTMKLRDQDTGNVIVSIDKNHWMVSKALSWDKNYNDDTLEVKDAKERVILQIRVLPNAVQVQAEFQQGRGDVNGGGLIQQGYYDRKKGFKSLFIYPSELHWAEIADPKQPW